MPESLTLLTSLIASAQKAGATAADALLYESATLSASRRMREPEGLERSESRGIGLRIFVGARSAVVSSSDTGKDALSELVSRAVTIAKLAPEDPYTGLAPKELLAGDIPSLDVSDPHEPDIKWLQEQCTAAEDAALAVKGITNSNGAEAYTGRHYNALATSTGFAQEYRSSSSSVSVSVLAGEGAGMERDYEVSSARFVSDLMSAETVGRNAGRYALEKLGSRKVSTQQVPVVYHPRVARGLLGNFAGAINGNSITRGTSFLKEQMGRPVFAFPITIIDDPHRRRGLGSRPFDGEGLANRKTALIENGVLKSWLLDMRSANKLGLPPTGHASRSLSSPPSPSSSNLYMEAGALSPEELIGDIASGFYVTEVFGMGVNLVTGDYSQGASGIWIEKGQKAYPVSEVTVAGKLQDMFLHMTPASDLEFRYSTNAPTLRIEGMMVAGK